MTKDERVCAAIRNCIDKPKCKDCPWTECEKPDCERVNLPLGLVRDALELLEAQKPIKPRIINERYECGFCFQRITDWENFCPICGKAVKKG